MDQPVILITGGVGRIGRALSAVLTPHYRVVGLERACAPDAEHCLEADIGADAALARAMDRFREQYGRRIASVIHLAAYYDFSGEKHPAYREVNVEGTGRLLHALAEFDVQQFVHASTMLVHAPTEPGMPINEISELSPKWPYPRSKELAEPVVLEAHGDMPVVILRIAGVYTNQGEVPSLTMQLQRIYERQWSSHLFPGNPAHGQSFVHIDDLSDAVQRVVTRRAELPHCTTLLIGEPVTESDEALQNLMGQQLHGEPWETRSIPKSVAAGGAWMQAKMEVVVPDAIDGGIAPFVKPFMIDLADDHYELDIDRARSLPGAEPHLHDCQQHHCRPDDHSPVPAVAGARQGLGALERSGAGRMAAARAAAVLDAKRGRLRQRHPGRGHAGPVRRVHSSHARGKRRRPGHRPRDTAWLDLLSVKLEPAHSYCRARLRGPVRVALPGRLPDGSHPVRMGSLVRRRYGADRRVLTVRRPPRI